MYKCSHTNPHPYRNGKGTGGKAIPIKGNGQDAQASPDIGGKTGAGTAAGGESFAGVSAKEPGV